MSFFETDSDHPLFINYHHDHREMYAKPKDIYAAAAELKTSFPIDTNWKYMVYIE